MAFDIKGLVKIANGPAFSDGALPRQLWWYASPDAQSSIRFADYFLNAINLIQVNDVLIITAATGGTPLVYLAYCNANNGTTIDITDGLQVTATDTD